MNLGSTEILIGIVLILIVFVVNLFPSKRSASELTSEEEAAPGLSIFSDPAFQQGIVAAFIGLLCLYALDLSQQ
jgi:hypothetical protein